MFFIILFVIDNGWNKSSLSNNNPTDYTYYFKIMLSSTTIIHFILNEIILFFVLLPNIKELIKLSTDNQLIKKTKKTIQITMTYKHKIFAIILQ